MKSLLLTIFFVTSVLAALVEYVQEPDNSYAWLSYVNTAQTSLSRDQMRSAVKRAYDEMTADARDRGLVAPSTMALLFQPNVGSLFHSSIRNRQATDRPLINTCTDRGHRYAGNCAEMAAIDEWLQRQNVPVASLQNSAFIAVYGIENPTTAATDWLHPCRSTAAGQGCHGILESADILCLTKRGLELFEVLPVDDDSSSSRSSSAHYPAADGNPAVQQIRLEARAGPTGVVGPTGTQGPTATVGPTSTPGPTGTVGPTSKPGPTSTPSSGAACKAGKVKRFVVEPFGIERVFRRSFNGGMFFGDMF